ncbi:S8 family peptidase [Paraflavitalea soli]|uniref:S8 family peptidase n=2 Tax=Paraflavitalea soli TaxID=2315862 RepID=A0A3B7MNK6_9BACT|nr:S8 family peptidase [Paraflavitalea soli]
MTVISCKKNDSPASTMQQDQEPACEPVQFTSTAIDGRYIVMLNEAGATGRLIQSADQARVATNVLRQKHRIADAQLDEVLSSIHTGFIARLTSKQADELKADDGVQLVERDRVITLGVGCFTVVKPSSAQWGVRRVGAGDGTGKRVWIIDTGVDPDHPDLNVDKTLSKSFITDETSITDNNGHGTHVAGIIGALNNNIGTLGVASGVSIIALKALNGEGSGNTSGLIRALNYVGQNAQAGEVVNMSLGTDTVSLALDNAVRTLAARGILFAIAAGNDRVKASLSSPARVNAANVFTVSAIDSLGRFASFSNFGNDVVDFAAPGVNIVSTYSQGRYARLSGTSMAAPHVAGILVLNGAHIIAKGTALNDPDGVPDPIAAAY